MRGDTPKEYKDSAAKFMMAFHPSEEWVIQLWVASPQKKPRRELTAIQQQFIQIFLGVGCRIYCPVSCTNARLIIAYPVGQWLHTNVVVISPKISQFQSGSKNKICTRATSSHPIASAHRSPLTWILPWTFLSWLIIAAKALLYEALPIPRGV